jgi:hypothetical protein
MNPQEQRLIEDLFTRLKSVSSAEKDEDAAQHIRDLVAHFPDAPYYLTQSVLVQQQALDQAGARIKELEQLGQETRPGGQRSAASFLGSSVPQAGQHDSDAPQPVERPDRSPWAQPAPARSGGFLSSALSTATGVAGGMFLADSIRSLFGSGGGGFLGNGSASATENQAALDKAQDQAQDAEEDAKQARQDLAADDAALDDMQDEQDDDWSDDDGSMDV